MAEGYGSDHEYTIDDYFEHKARRWEKMKMNTLLKARVDRLDEYAVLMRPDLLIDDAAGKEIGRRLKVMEKHVGRVGGRRKTV